MAAAEENDAPHLSFGIDALRLQHLVVVFVDIIGQEVKACTLDAALKPLDDAGKKRLLAPRTITAIESVESCFKCLALLLGS